VAFIASPRINISYEECAGNPDEVGSATTLCIPTEKNEAVLRGLIHSSDNLKQTDIK